MPNKEPQTVSYAFMAVCTVLFAGQAFCAADHFPKACNMVDKVAQNAGGGDDGDGSGDGGSSFPMADIHYRVWQWCLSTTTAFSALWGGRWLEVTELNLEVVVPVVFGFVLFVVGLLWWNLWFDHTYSSHELTYQSKEGVEEEATLESGDKDEIYADSPGMENQGELRSVIPLDSLNWTLSTPVPWSVLLMEDVNYYTGELFGKLDPSEDNGLLVSVFINILGLTQVALKPFFVHSALDPSDGKIDSEGRGGDDHASPDAPGTASDPDVVPGIDNAATDTAASRIQTENNTGVF